MASALTAAIVGDTDGSNDVVNPLTDSFRLTESLQVESPHASKHTSHSINSALSRSRGSASKDVPNMWSRDYIGLYAQYAAVGLLYGSTSYTANTFCPYVYDGDPNLCANAANIAFFAWSFKILFAIGTDIYRPFGMRRKPYMLAGWLLVLTFLLILTCLAHILDASSWLAILMLIQAFLMLSDVPADGYSVELGKLEPDESKGSILATGQMIRFISSVLAAAIQTFLLNGTSTNASDCTIDFNGCWAWGLNVNEYYGLLFAIVLVLTIPIFWLKELETDVPLHTLEHFRLELWDTMQSRTTLSLLVYVVGISGLCNFVSKVNYYMQYYIIELTNFQAGLDGIITFAVLSFAIWLFRTYLINKSWRRTSYGSNIFAATLGLLWLPAYWGSGGTRNAYYTIFVDLDQSFVQGISQVLFSMSVIELSKPGQEATTYELLITVANAALTFSGIVATQLLFPLNAVDCTEEPCPSDSVDISDGDQGYEDTDGPQKYTNYCLCLFSITVVTTLIFTPLLPDNKEQCLEWRDAGERAGLSKTIGYISLTISVIMVLYGFIAGVLLLDSSTSCLAIVGGTGC